jgi:ribonucleoside-diphosphate reductase alpha chain
MYYHNTRDGASENMLGGDDEDCEGGACKI